MHGELVFKKIKYWKEWCKEKQNQAPKDVYILVSIDLIRPWPSVVIYRRS